MSLRWPIYIINSGQLSQSQIIKTRSACLGLDLLTRTWLGLSSRLHKTIWLIFWLFYTSYKGKRKTLLPSPKILFAILWFAYTQSRPIPAVTHIKILLAEHAQRRCLYASHNIYKYLWFKFQPVDVASLNRSVVQEFNLCNLNSKTLSNSKCGCV